MMIPELNPRDFPNPSYFLNIDSNLVKVYLTFFIFEAMTSL